MRTLTLHLPTNLPPPLHSEVIWTSPAYQVGIGIGTAREDLNPSCAAKPVPGNGGCPQTRRAGNRTCPALPVQQEASEQDYAQCWEQPGIPISRLSHHPSPACSHGSLHRHRSVSDNTHGFDNGSDVVLRKCTLSLSQSSSPTACAPN